MGDLYMEMEMELDGGITSGIFYAHGYDGGMRTSLGYFSIFFLLRPSSDPSGPSREADLVEPIYRHSSHGLN